jgi:hypothetical protein
MKIGCRLAAEANHGRFWDETPETDVMMHLKHLNFEQRRAAEYGIAPRGVGRCLSSPAPVRARP